MQDRVKEDENIIVYPIGRIHTPYKDSIGMPIQPNGARGIRGTVEVDPAYAEGLQDLDGFSRIILIYAFHHCKSCDLKVVPFLDTEKRGVFSTRAPRRPNPLGISVVRLTGIEGRVLFIEDVDILDGTPLLDIKPYVPAFDSYPDAVCGWLDNVVRNPESLRSDTRFL